MTEVYLYCGDRSKQKEIKEEIERDAGIKIKRVVRSLDAIKDDYGIGIIIIDEFIDLGYEFKTSDILVALDKIDFRDWMYLTERGIEVAECSKGFKSLGWLLATRGVEGSNSNDPETLTRITNMKYSIKEHFERYKGKIYSFYSVGGSTGKSTIAMSSARLIKSRLSNKRVLVMDRVKQFSSINYLIHNDKRYEKVEGSVDNLYRDTQLDVFIYSPDTSIKIIKDTGSTDIISVIDSIKKHFDIILIDTDGLFDSDLMSIIDISDKVFVVSDNKRETIDKSEKLIQNTLYTLGMEQNKYMLVLNKNTENDAKNIAKHTVFKVPFSSEIALNNDTHVYIKSDTNLDNHIEYMYHSCGLFELDKKQLAIIGF